MIEENKSRSDELDIAKVIDAILAVWGKLNSIFPGLLSPGSIRF